MEDTQTVSTNPEDQDPNASIKTRLANLLINRVALSECLNVIRDACMERAGEIVESADEEDMKKILSDIDIFENPPEPNENVTQSSSGPVPTGPVGASEVTPVETGPTT